ncbi:hypothetical protein [Compostibacter hankyongensis]|uniref:Lipocalin-like domain-containing protein n=1 Tax=Compostibacter hankyongensis TaxID=1007089 RepID=A0ABP8G1X9_9BACT
MKNKYRIILPVLAAALCVFASCKKDENKSPSKKIDGTYHAFELTLNGQTTELPTDDENIDIQIASSGDKKAKVTLIDNYKGKPTEIPFDCTVSEDEEGEVVLTGSNDNGTLHLDFWNKTSIEFDFYNERSNEELFIGASKDGKKPGDW